MRAMDQLLTSREIEDKVAELVARARREHGFPAGCGGGDACERVGLVIRCGPLPPGTDGLLADGQIIVSDIITWPARVEFTIFHELMHHLLDEDGELIEFFTGVLRNDAPAFRAAIERCCNAGAAEFMLPRAAMRASIAANGFSVELIARVADDHGASLVAAALQLARYAPVDCYVVLAAHGPIPRESPPRHGLHLEYAFSSPGVPYPLARFTPVPPDHLLTTVWRERTPEAGPSSIPFRSGRRMPCHGEARLVGSRALGVLMLRRPPPRGQLGLPLL